MPDIEIYNEKALKADEKVFERSLQTGNVDLAAFKRTMMYDLLNHTDIISDGCIGDIRLEDIQKAIQHPVTGWRTLLRASDMLMRVSPHYYRLNTFFSNMAVFLWWVDLYGVSQTVNVPTLRKRYSKLVDKLESMNLKHEFTKIMHVLPYQDIYCGLVVEDSKDFFLQKIDFNICKLYQVQDGLYNFKINLGMIKRSELGAYPDYVKDAYLDYVDGKVSSYWYVPPADKQICIKMNTQWTYPFPMLIGLAEDVLDLDTYKKLKLQSARTDNYKAILIQVPIDETAVDHPLISLEMLSAFTEMNKANMTDDIGILHTLGKGGQVVSFKDSSNTRNNVSDANDEVYNTAGVTKELFNGSATATAVKATVDNSSAFMYGVYRQIERWVNRFIKVRNYPSASFKFNFYLLDATIFNRADVTKRYADAVTLGATVVDKWMASMDMTPSRTLGSYYLHNDIFDFNNNFVPLASTYTESANQSDGGRPTNEEKGEALTDEGERTMDGDKNNN